MTLLCSWCRKPDISMYSLLCMNCNISYLSCADCFKEKGGVEVTDEYSWVHSKKESLVWCQECYWLDHSYPIYDFDGYVLMRLYDEGDNFVVNGKEIHNSDEVTVIRSLINEIERFTEYVKYSD